MPDGINRYSLLIVPNDPVGARLQSLINKLAAEYDGPRFVPHVTLLGNIFAKANEIAEVQQKIEELTQHLSPFTINLTEWGFTDEEFRCLYFRAASLALTAVYENMESKFPQVGAEHFRQMPHVSILYGHYSQSVKNKIIAANDFLPLKFDVEAFELHVTNSPVSSWHKFARFPLLNN